MELVNTAVEKYAEEHTTEPSEYLQNLVQDSDRELDFIDMLSGRVVGRLLAMLVKISGAERILEIGTFTGYSALSMAEALPETGVLITCEYNEHYEPIARTAFKNSPHGKKIILKMGAALETIEKMDDPFDFVFLDADKINYPQYYQAVLPMLKSGSLLVIDNVLWQGSVLEPQDDKARAIDRLNRMIAQDDRVEKVMLTIRDGVTIVRKR